MTASTLLRGPLVLLAIVGLVGLVVPALAADNETAVDDRATQETLQWFAEMDAYFEANPELKTAPGSGWKPFNRIKWFTEQRMFEGRLPAADARWNAWKEKQRREASMTPRSTWFSLGPTNFGGRMLDLDFDPSDTETVYAGGADGGVWKTTDGGATWAPKSDDIPSLAVGGIAVSRTNSNIVVIGTGEGTNNIDRVGGVGILRSTDAGETWLLTDLSLNNASGHGFHCMEAGPNGTFLGGATDGVWRSTDDGATWTQVRSGDDFYDIVWKPGEPNTVYTVKGNGASANNVKVSTDDGVTWTKAGSGQPLSFLIGKSKLAVTPADPDVMYALFGAADGGGVTGVYRTTDGATTWTAQNTNYGEFGGQTWYNLVISVDASNVDRVIAGAVSLRRSGNGGVSFTNVGSGVHSDQHAVEYAPGMANNVWLAGDGGVYRSGTDGASGTWQNLNNGLVTYQFYDICVNNGPTSYYIMGGTQDNGTDKWSGTTTWTNGLGADGMVCNVSAVNGTTVYAEIQFGSHRKSTTSGSNGSFFNINSGLTGSGNWVTAVDLDPNDTNKLYTSTSDGIFRSSNGTSWSNVASHGANWISVSPVDGRTVWTVAGGSPFLSTDGGNSWVQTAAYGFPNGGARKVLAHPTDEPTAFVVYGSYSTTAKVGLTTNYGASWTDVSGNFPAEPANAIAVNPSDPTQWFVGTDLGVYVSENGGANWNPFLTGLPNVVVSDVEIQDALQKLVAGTHGRGAWEADIPLAGIVDAPVSVARTRNLMLDPPAPNPVTDRVMFRFAAKYEGPVSLEVFDVQGRLVSRVSELATGDGVVRTAPWFVDDRPAGVYFAVLTAGSEQVTRKIVVTR